MRSCALQSRGGSGPGDRPAAHIAAPTTGGFPACPPSAPAHGMTTPAPDAWGPSLSVMQRGPRAVLTCLSLLAEDTARLSTCFSVLARCVLLGDIPAPVMFPWDL